MIILILKIYLMSDKFGMMDSAYFTSKSEILKWLNNTLKLNVTRIEQASTGAIYCQLLDVLYPGKVKMQKVNWKASQELDFLQNLKVLQQSLTDLGINKEIDISKIAKGRYQDNFEILQWFKGFFDNKNPDLSSYNAEQRRNYSTLTYMTNNNKELSKRKIESKQRTRSKEKKGLSTTQSTKLTHDKLASYIGKVNINSVKGKTESEGIKVNILNTNSNLNSSFNKENLNVVSESFAIEIEKKYEEEMNLLVDENEKNKREIKTLKMLLAEVGREKEFYYSKLRDFEFLLNKGISGDKSSLINTMKTILYSTKENEVTIDQYGNPSIKN